MFKKKYIFETKRTKALRIFKVLWVILLFPIAAYIFFAISIVQISQNENERTQQFFFKKHPDLIAVFTGDSGRIEYSFQQAIKYKTSKIFITGVYSKNSIDTLLNKYYPIENVDTLDVEEDQTRELVEIDYLAKNTIENVLSTHRYLKQGSGFNTILIVSSDYHLYRIKTIVEKLIPQSEGHSFFYFGTETKFDNYRGIKKLLSEVLKNIKARLFLLLWSDSDEFTPTPSQAVE